MKTEDYWVLLRISNGRIRKLRPKLLKEFSKLKHICTTYHATRKKH